MPRKPRFYLPGVPTHVIQRGNCRQAVFFADNDYRAYLTWLAEGAKKRNRGEIRDRPRLLKGGALVGHFEVKNDNI